MLPRYLDQYFTIAAIHCSHFSLFQDCEAHACLLCSLLLGFGLDAYVCIGTKAKGLAHAWVMTRPQGGEVVFWESITGQR